MHTLVSSISMLRSYSLYNEALYFEMENVRTSKRVPPHSPNSSERVKLISANIRAGMDIGMYNGDSPGKTL